MTAQLRVVLTCNGPRESAAGCPARFVGRADERQAGTRVHAAQQGWSTVAVTGGYRLELDYCPTHSPDPKDCS